MTDSTTLDKYFPKIRNSPDAVAVQITVRVHPDDLQKLDALGSEYGVKRPFMLSVIIQQAYDSEFENEE